MDWSTGTTICPSACPATETTSARTATRRSSSPCTRTTPRPSSKCIKERVRQADYIILSSNRLYRTIPKLPQRYPMSTTVLPVPVRRTARLREDRRIQRLPAARTVGVQRRRRRRELHGVRPSAADDLQEGARAERRRVGDPVRPLVGKRDPGLRGQAAAPVAPVDRQPALCRICLPASPAIGPPSRTLDRRRRCCSISRSTRCRSWTTSAGTPSPPSRRPSAIVFWWLVVVVVGWLGWPLAFATFRNLADRGYMLSKTLTLLVVAYLIWLPASFRLAQNRLSYILPMLGLIGLCSLWLLWRYRDEIGEFCRRHWRLILVNEALFGGAYLIFVGIRLLNPDLWQPWLGGEKFMDFAFLNATLKSAYFPPYDPYFAGGYLNYYYYGQYAVGLWVKLTGIAPTVGFNLVVPTLFALTVGNAFCLGYNLLVNRLRRSGVRRGHRAHRRRLRRRHRQPGRLPADLAKAGGDQRIGFHEQPARPAGHRARLRRPAAGTDRAPVTAFQLLGPDAGYPVHHQRVPVLQLSVRRPAPAHDQHAVRAVVRRPVAEPGSSPGAQAVADAGEDLAGAGNGCRCAAGRCHDRRPIPRPRPGEYRTRLQEPARRRKSTRRGRAGPG